MSDIETTNLSEENKGGHLLFIGRINPNGYNKETFSLS